jgi:hypothetical protein
MATKATTKAATTVEEAKDRIADEIPQWYGGGVMMNEVEDLVYLKVIDRLRAQVVQEKKWVQGEIRKFVEAFNVACASLQLQATVEEEEVGWYREVPYVRVTSAHGRALIPSGSVIDQRPFDAAVMLLRRTEDSRAAFSARFVEQKLKGAAPIDSLVDDMVEQLTLAANLKV